MMYSRRGFIGLIGLSLIGAGLPSGWLPKTVKRESAVAYMTQEWNKWARGRGGRAGRFNAYAGRELYEAFSNELMSIQRFTSTAPNDDYKSSFPLYHYLVFKGGKLRVEGEGWRIRFEQV